jgi:hypothetical protein
MLYRVCSYRPNYKIMTKLVPNQINTNHPFFNIIFLHLHDLIILLRGGGLGHETSLVQPHFKCL